MARAAKASRKMIHMGRLGLASCAVILGLIAGCASVPAPFVPPTAASSPPAVPPLAVPSPSPSSSTADLLRDRSRWVPASWVELPGWFEDRTQEVWPALLAGCEKPANTWAKLCAQAKQTSLSDDAQTREWLMARLQPYQVIALDGQETGLATGYFEPAIEASRVAKAGFKVPLYRLPGDIRAGQAYWTRQQLDNDQRSVLRGREIAYIEDPLDALVLQIQGSGRLHILEPDGSTRWVRMAFAGHNEQPYKSVGRWLIDQGELSASSASWPAIKDWARRNPKRLNEMLWSNPRVVFFREEPLNDLSLGPKGAQGVALSAGRSIAVDKASIPLGTLIFMVSTEPLSDQALQRTVMAQDTGSAIVGAVRADFFWGTGPNAEQQAGRMKQPLKLWALWPKE